MKAYRIEISTWTSSFRYPNVISGFQPTLTVPPISTVLGLINACAGKYIKHNQLNIGYYFDFKAKCVDLETIYQFELDKKSVKNQVKSNIIAEVALDYLYASGCKKALKDVSKAGESLVQLIAKQEFNPMIEKTYPFADIEKAFEEIPKNGMGGKYVIEM